jgi:hypothetical protein
VLNTHHGVPHTTSVIAYATSANRGDATRRAPRYTHTAVHAFSTTSPMRNTSRSTPKRRNSTPFTKNTDGP